MPRFYLRAPRPNERRKSFRIYKDGHPFPEPRIEALSASYVAGQVDFEVAQKEAYKVLREIKEVEREALQRESFPEPNLNVLQQAIKEYEGKDEEEETSARSKKMGIANLRRAVEVLGKEVIHSLSEKALRDLVKKQDPPYRPKFAVALNTLLRHAGREERVLIPRAIRREVNYLTPQDMDKMLKHLPKEYRVCVSAAFATGCRQGEVFALRRLTKKASVIVDRQLRPDGTYGPPKWRKVEDEPRTAVIIAWGRDAVKKWIRDLRDMSETDRLELRNLPWGDIIREACQKAFPDQTHKHLTFRDIRHSYAVYWLDRGATAHHVAQNMGNSDKVVSDHYVGIVLTDEAEDSLLSLEDGEEREAA